MEYGIAAKYIAYHRISYAYHDNLSSTPTTNSISNMIWSMSRKVHDLYFQLPNFEHLIVFEQMIERVLVLHSRNPIPSGKSCLNLSDSLTNADWWSEALLLG